MHACRRVRQSRFFFRLRPHYSCATGLAFFLRSGRISTTCQSSSLTQLQRRGTSAHWPGSAFVTSEPATQDRARRSLSLVLHRSPSPATATHGLALLPLTPAADSSGAPAPSPPRQAWCQDKPVTGLASLPRRVRSAAELFCFPLGGPPAASERPARRKTFWTVGIVVKRGSVAMRRAQHGRKRQ